MKITLANMFNHKGEVYVKTYDETGSHTDNHHDFDSAVHFLVKNGYTIKLQDANERGYSLWFEKVDRKASQNDEACTKMIAEKIAKGEIDSFKPKQEESI